MGWTSVQSLPVETLIEYSPPPPGIEATEE